MKLIMRWLLGPVWWISRPVRRVLMGRFDARVVRLVADTVDERLLPPILAGLDENSTRLDRIESLMIRADRSASTMLEEADVVLNDLTREIFRLRAQVERIRCDDRTDSIELSVLRKDEGDEISAGRSKVG